MKNDKSDKKAKENELYAIEVQKMMRYHLNYAMYEMAKKRITNYIFEDRSIQPALFTVIKLFAVK